MVDIHDVQNYYLSFFGGIHFPKAETTGEIVEEVKKDETSED